MWLKICKWKIKRIKVSTQFERKGEREKGRKGEREKGRKGEREKGKREKGRKGCLKKW
jgi:hypothetical protein